MKWRWMKWATKCRAEAKRVMMINLCNTCFNEKWGDVCFYFMKIVLVVVWYTFFLLIFIIALFWCYQMIFNPLKTNQRDKCYLVRAWETFSTTTFNFFLSITTKQFYSNRKVMKMFKHLFTILHRWDTFRCTSRDGIGRLFRCNCSLKFCTKRIM